MSSQVKLVASCSHVVVYYNVICVGGVHGRYYGALTISDHIKSFLDDPRWHEHIKDPQLTTSQRGELPQIYNST